MTFLTFFYIFIFYSFFGWLVETTFCSIIRNRFVNMSFLDGPFSPIYGFSALAIILLAFPFSSNLLLFFIMSTIITSIIEYVTSLFFEKAFGIVWWNYSYRPFNINGRICLQYSFYWGVLAVLVLTVIHPSIIPVINFLSTSIGYYGIIIFIIYLSIDVTNTFNVFLNFKKNISKEISSEKIPHKKIIRLIKAFPDVSSKVNSDFIIKYKLKIKNRKSD